jgi:apolipoprotein N-acyltransferase
MFESVLAKLAAFYNAIPFSAATWSVIITLMVFLWLFSKASRDPKSPIKWEHLIVDSQNDRASPYKLGFMLGMIVSTWIVVNFADKDKLTFDIFGMYLTYLLGGAGFNTFIKSKSNPGVVDPTEEKDPTKQ